MRRTVGQKLVLSFLLMAILMAAVGAFSVYNLNRLNTNTEQILREHQPVLTDMAAIESGVLFHSLKVEQYVTTGNRAHLRAVGEVRNRVESHLADLETRTQGTEDQQLVREIREAYDTYVSLSDEMQAFYLLNPDEAAAIAGRQMRIAALLENALLAKADALYAAKQSKAQELMEANRTLYLTAFRITVASSAILTLLALALSVFISRSISVPIGQLVESTRRVTGGDLTARAPVKSADEIGALATAFNTMTAQLQGVIGTLEQRVEERTVILAQRAIQLQAAADVAQATTSVLDPDELLRRVVDLVRERFGLYYAGLFLLDEERKFAVLRAGTGEAGQQMLAQGHRLEVGGNSMIGQCTARAEARIALDVGEEAIRFDNPLLPYTRSEMALPLRSRGRVIGAMSVQSAEEVAFDEADIAVMQTMADQVAAAIDNAQLFAETQATIEEMEAIQRRYLAEAWAEYLRGRTPSGYEYTKQGQAEAKIVPLGNAVLPEVPQTTQRSSSDLVVPVLLRGHPIGALGFKPAERDRPWSDEDVVLAEAISEQFALAAESLRLLDETQRRAIEERLIGEVTARMRETLDMDTVLQTAIREMGEALGIAEVEVRMGSGTLSGAAMPTQGHE